MNKKTIEALIARGIDSKTAEILSAKKYTLSSLKQMNVDSLKKLGLTKQQAEMLLKETRPPVPKDTLIKVLYKSKRTCNICRNPSKPIIVHHIIEWSESHCHDENNLIVLCLEDHDLVHTRKELSQGISKKELEHAKKEWENLVSQNDSKNILKLKNAWDYSRWDWINIQRIFELAIKYNIDCKNNKLYSFLLQKGYIYSDGLITEEANWINTKSKKFWFLDFGDGMYIASYLSNIVDKILYMTATIDITPIIKSKKDLKSILAPSDYIVAQLPFYFKDITKYEQGKNQVRKSYYKGHGTIIEYTFDAWYCLSSSARFDAMSGRKVKTIFGFVRSIEEIDGELNISISCLSAGTAFKTHPAREQKFT
jgi:hypothetical protein